MTHIIPAIRSFLVSEDGPTAVEYAVMLALVLVACIKLVTSVGQTHSGTLNKITSSVGVSEASFGAKGDRYCLDLSAGPEPGTGSECRRQGPRRSRGA